MSRRSSRFGWLARHRRPRARARSRRGRDRRAQEGADLPRRHKMAPLEIEFACSAHPKVAAALAVGRPDERLGQRIHALVLPRERASRPRNCARSSPGAWRNTSSRMCFTSLPSCPRAARARPTAGALPRCSSAATFAGRGRQHESIRVDQGRADGRCRPPAASSPGAHQRAWQSDAAGDPRRARHPRSRRRSARHVSRCGPPALLRLRPQGADGAQARGSGRLARDPRARLLHHHALLGFAQADHRRDPRPVHGGRFRDGTRLRHLRLLARRHVRRARAQVRRRHRDAAPAVDGGPEGGEGHPSDRRRQ